MNNKKPNDDDYSDIPLSEMIKTLRKELISAQKLGKNEAILFDIEKVELELKVAVSRTAKAGGGIKFHVVNAEGGYEKTSQDTHTFKLTMKPILGETEGHFLISDLENGPLSEK
jgi:hypothetical protein